LARTKVPTERFKRKRPRISRSTVVRRSPVFQESRPSPDHGAIKRTGAGYRLESTSLD